MGCRESCLGVLKSLASQPSPRLGTNSSGGFKLSLFRRFVDVGFFPPDCLGLAFTPKTDLVRYLSVPLSAKWGPKHESLKPVSALFSQVVEGQTPRVALEVLSHNTTPGGVLFGVYSHLHALPQSLSKRVGHLFLTFLELVESCLGFCLGDLIDQQGSIN